MGKLYDFLMQKDDAIKTREVMIGHFPEPFVIKNITQRENKMVRRAATRTIIDQKTRQQQKFTDPDDYNTKLIVACCVEPNLKDAALQAHFGVMGAEDLLEVMLDPGEYTDLLLAVQEICSFDNINDLREEAKN